MLNQFRQSYPQGCLISELITIDCGQYIVRVSVQVDGITLATGLGADRMIEEAEDKARQRALNAIYLTPQPPKSSVVVSPSQSESPTVEIPPSSPEMTPTPPTVEVPPSPPEMKPETIPTAKVAEKLPIPEEPEVKITEEKPKKTAKSSKKSKETVIPPVEKEIPVTPPQPTLEEEKSMTPPVEKKTPVTSSQPTLDLKEESMSPSVEPEIPLMSSQPTLEEEKESIVTETPEIPPIEEPITEEEPLLSLTEEPAQPEIVESPSEPTPEPEKAPEIPESMDFSDIITKSNAELKRLRWTQEEGRDYLIRTYGKRSRQLLSDEELLEFLYYLQSLPNPPKD